MNKTITCNIHPYTNKFIEKYESKEDKSLIDRTGTPTWFMNIIR